MARRPITLGRVWGPWLDVFWMGHEKSGVRLAVSGGAARDGKTPKD